MHNELTQEDINQMKAELEERRRRAPALRDEVKRTREYGDLSENDEYRCAKREYNANKSRIRYLENMIETAHIISVDSPEGVVGLFDTVKIRYPEEEDEDEMYRTVRIVTTLRNDVFTDNISKDSPFGKALLGARVGQTVTVKVNDRSSYPVEILSIEKGKDDPNLKISTY